jgi:hypothetical protein
MTRHPSFLIRPVLAGNGDRRADQRMPRLTWVVASEPVELADGADLPLNAPSGIHGAYQTWTSLHVNFAKRTHAAPHRTAAEYNRHSHRWSAV